MSFVARKYDTAISRVQDLITVSTDDKTIFTQVVHVRPNRGPAIDDIT